MKNKKLSSIRNKIDKVDNDIFILIKKRTNIVKQMLMLKRYKKQIVDQTRIKSILSSIRKKSIQNNIDPKITSKIWKSIIWSYVEFQRRNFKKK